MTRVRSLVVLLVAAIASYASTIAVAAEPSEAEMRAAVALYLQARNTEPAGSPRYFDATAIALFKKLSCEPPSDNSVYACRYRIEVGTQYRESRTTTHLFAQQAGGWVSLGPRVTPPASPAN